MPPASRSRSGPGSICRSGSNAAAGRCGPRISWSWSAAAATCSPLARRLHAEGVPWSPAWTGCCCRRRSASGPARRRFAAQPLDDLNLASLLVSPLFGWSQDQLLEAAAGGRARSGRSSASSRRRTRRSTPPRAARHGRFYDPHGFFEAILSGPLDGRRKLLTRLGREARDPIEELLSSALQFEAAGPLSLQAFLDWFERGEVEIVRDPSGPLDAVRVMTVHGAKGLQSPVVILADACADPDRSRNLPGRFPDLRGQRRDAEVPVFRPRKEEPAEPLASRVESRPGSSARSIGGCSTSP